MQPSERAKQIGPDYLAPYGTISQVRSVGIVNAASRDQSSGSGNHAASNPTKPSFTELPLAISQMAIDHASLQPIYKQICQMFRAAISTGDLPSGLLLPTTHEMAAALKVTRNTV